MSLFDRSVRADCDDRGGAARGESEGDMSRALVLRMCVAADEDMVLGDRRPQYSQEPTWNGENLRNQARNVPSRLANLGLLGLDVLLRTYG